MKKLLSLYYTDYGNDFDLKNYILSQINGIDQNDLKIEYPNTLTITSAGKISGKNNVGKYNNIKVEIKDNNKNVSFEVRELKDVVTSNASTRESKINHLKKKYSDNFEEYNKVIDYLDFIKDNLNKSAPSLALPLVIQSFLEINFKLFLKELNGIKKSVINPEDKSGDEIKYDETKEYNINNYTSQVLKMMLDQKKEIIFMIFIKN